MALSSLSDLEYADVFQAYHKSTIRALSDGVFNLWQQMNNQQKFIADSGTKYYAVMGSNVGADLAVQGVMNTLGSFIDYAFNTGLIVESQEAMGSRVAGNGALLI